MKEEIIRLPHFLIADLYKDSLVLIGEEPKKVVNEPNKEIPTTSKKWFLGTNLQKITLFVHEKEAVYLSEESLQFLTNILNACKLNLGDVAIINTANDSYNYSSVKEALSSQIMLFFGVSANEIAVPFVVPDYQIQNFDNCQFLFAPALSTMRENTALAKAEKTKLWQSLKKIFNI